MPAMPATKPGEALPYWGPFLVPPEARHKPLAAQRNPQIAMQLQNSNREYICGMSEAAGQRTMELANPNGLSEIVGIVAPQNVADLARSTAADTQRVYVQVNALSGDCGYDTAGYLSLVLPRFATGKVGLDGSFLVVRGEDGSWSALDPTETIEGER